MSTPQPSADALRDGIRVSVASVAWTVCASTAAIVTGFLWHVIVLVAFGATGVLDAAGSLIIALNFQHALRHDAFSVARERIALRVVGVGMIAVAAYTIAESARRLLTPSITQRSVATVLIPGASCVVLAAFTVWKRAVARRIPSPALMADSRLSAMGALLGAIAVAGAPFAGDPRLEWVDPVAALVVAGGASTAGVTSLRREARELR